MNLLLCAVGVCIPLDLWRALNVQLRQAPGLVDLFSGFYQNLSSRYLAVSFHSHFCAFFTFWIASLLFLKPRECLITLSGKLLIPTHPLGFSLANPPRDLSPSTHPSSLPSQITWCLTLFSHLLHCPVNLGSFPPLQPCFSKEQSLFFISIHCLHTIHGQ